MSQIEEKRVSYRTKKFLIIEAIGRMKAEQGLLISNIKMTDALEDGPLCEYSVLSELIRLEPYAESSGLGGAILKEFLFTRPAWLQSLTKSEAERRAVERRRHEGLAGLLSHIPTSKKAEAFERLVLKWDEIRNATPEQIESMLTE